MRNVCGAQNDPALFHVNARMLACSFSCCLASQRQFSADVIVCSGMRGDGKRWRLASQRLPCQCWRGGSDDEQCAPGQGQEKYKGMTNGNSISQGRG